MLDWWLCNFNGIQTSIAKEPFIFVIFPGAGGPDPLSPLWIRTCSIKHCWLYFASKIQVKYLNTLYLRRVAHTCIGTALIVLILSLRAKVHFIDTLYLFPMLQNCEHLSTKHNIDLVNTENPRPQTVLVLTR